MDPISIAGVGLSTASLTAQAFVGCIQAIDLVLRAKGLKPELRYLNLRLELEKQRLWNWSEACGLIAFLAGNEKALRSSVSGVNRHLTLEVVHQIQILTVDFVKVKGRYSEFSEETLSKNGDATGTKDLTSNSAIVATDEGVNGGDSTLEDQFPSSAEVVKRIMRGLEVTQQLPKRLRWAAWDQKKFEGLVSRLRELNDSLMNLTDQSMQAEILEMTKQTNIGLLDLCNKVEDLSQLFIALKREEYQIVPTLPSAFKISQTSASYRLQRNENAQLLDLCRFKVLTESMGDRETVINHAVELQLKQPSEQLRHIELQYSDITVVDAQPGQEDFSETTRSEALYQEQRVWIEWKEYQPVDLTSKADPLVVDRVRKLAALLHSDKKPVALRLPTCLGYFDLAETAEDNSFQFGLVFMKPPDIDPKAIPVSLLALLKQDFKPSLTERILLAKELANCLRYLHSVNWLHKGLRSHNIIFYPCKTGRIDYGCPYLSGFDYARPAQKEEFTEDLPVNPEYDLYRHPKLHRATTREGYKTSFDIYSLGIVLLEIADWRSIDEILGISDPTTTGARVTLGIRDRLLTNAGFMEMASAGAGELYMHSVQCCLQGGAALGIEEDDDETVDAVRARLGKGFYEKVIRRIESIRY